MEKKDEESHLQSDFRKEEERYVQRIVKKELKKKKIEYEFFMNLKLEVENQ
jgi:hypothetical protein